MDIVKLLEVVRKAEEVVFQSSERKQEDGVRVVTVAPYDIDQLRKAPEELYVSRLQGR